MNTMTSFEPILEVKQLGRKFFFYKDKIIVEEKTKKTVIDSCNLESIKYKKKCGIKEILQLAFLNNVEMKEQMSITFDGKTICLTINKKNYLKLIENGFSLKIEEV